MKKENILVIDDEEDILELVRYNLTKEGYAVHCVASGEEGLKVARAQKPNLIILDLMLPGIDGLDVCKLLKGDPATQHLTIIMLSAKGEESDVVTGLELGADDYVTKPFSPKILIARVRSALRRRSEKSSDENSPLVREGLKIDPARHEVHLGGQLLDLTATEYKLLHFLARHPGMVFTRLQLVTAVHGDDYPVTDRSVDVQIVGLRRKLGDFGLNIETVRGVGYRMKD